MWKVIQACIQGISHVKHGVPCQDVVRSKLINDRVIIALSDGAGSSEFSLYGAEITCDSIIDYFDKNFDTCFKMPISKVQETIIHSIRTRLGLKAKKMDSTKEEFASTLLFVCVRNKRFIAGHIGDGIIGAIKDGECVVLSLPERGEYANTTFFTTSENYHSHFRLYKGSVEKYSSIFLMSDGAADCLYDKRNKSFAKAISIFNTWMETKNIDEVNVALYENMSKLFPKYTFDDCSFIMCHKVTHNETNSKEPIDI